MLCLLASTEINREMCSRLGAHLAGCIYKLWKPFSLLGVTDVPSWRTFLIKRIQATPGMIPGLWFHVFAWNSLVKDVCVFTSTRPCNQSPKPVGTPEHTPQHNSSCGPSPHRRSISDRISDRAARASGQIGCPVRLLTFGGGKKIWAVKKNEWEGCWGMLRLLIMSTCVCQNKNSGNIRRRDCRDENKYQTKQRKNRVYAEQNKTPWLENWIPLGEGKEQEADNEI